MRASFNADAYKPSEVIAITRLLRAMGESSDGGR